jgi:hypothetical protein
MKVPNTIVEVTMLSMVYSYFFICVHTCLRLKVNLELQVDVFKIIPFYMH